MYSIISGTILLGLIHALIPNHWLPLVAIARTERWSKSELLLIASVTATAHVLGPVLLGTLLGIIGSTLASTYEAYMHAIAPVLLIVFGLIYWAVARPTHHESVSGTERPVKKSRKKWVSFFILMMFMSPCLEVQSLFLAIGAFGLQAILLLGLVYALISITGIMAMVYFSYKGFQLINSSVIERHEKRITGVVLVVVGIVTFFIH